MNGLWILIWSMSLAIWIELSPIDQMGIMDALAIQAAEHYQCLDFTISVVAHKDKALFFFECKGRFTGGENMKQTMCLFHFIRPLPKANGDCKICIPDENNKNCKRYWPITVWTLSCIKEVENEKKSSL